MYTIRSSEMARAYILIPKACVQVSLGEVDNGDKVSPLSRYRWKLRFKKPPSVTNNGNNKYRIRNGRLFEVYIHNRGINKIKNWFSENVTPKASISLRRYYAFTLTTVSLFALIPSSFIQIMKFKTFNNLSQVLSIFYDQKYNRDRYIDGWHN